MTAAFIIPAGMLACVLFTQGQYDRLAAAVSLNRELAVPALLSRVADTQLLQYATPNATEALTVMDRLRDAGTSLYQRPLSRLLGRPLAVAGLPLAAGNCGAADGSDPVGSPPYDGRRFHGTLDVPASIILLVGTDEAVVGYGAPSEVPGGWRGYARGSTEAVAQVYAATASGLCPLTMSSAAAAPQP